MQIEEIRLFLQRYFDVLQSQDMAEFDQVFHASCVLYSQQNGQLTVRPFAAYREMVLARTSPAAKGSPRKEEILMIDKLSDTMAVAKVRLRLFDHIMEDHLNLMKHEGQWMIYAKHFTQAGVAS